MLDTSKKQLESIPGSISQKAAKRARCARCTLFFSEDAGDYSLWCPERFSIRIKACV